MFDTFETWIVLLGKSLAPFSLLGVCQRVACGVVCGKRRWVRRGGGTLDSSAVLPRPSRRPSFSGQELSSGPRESPTGHREMAGPTASAGQLRLVSQLQARLGGRGSSKFAEHLEGGALS